MRGITIFARSPNVCDALAHAVDGDVGLECRGAVVGSPLGVEHLDESDVVLVSRGLPLRDLLGFVGRLWQSPHPPRVVFVDDPGGDEGGGTIEVDPTSLQTLLDAVRGAVREEVSTARVRVRFRPCRRSAAPATVRPLAPPDARPAAG